RHVPVGSPARALELLVPRGSRGSALRLSGDPGRVRPPPPAERARARRRGARGARGGDDRPRRCHAGAARRVGGRPRLRGDTPLRARRQRAARAARPPARPAAPPPILQKPRPPRRVLAAAGPPALLGRRLGLRRFNEFFKNLAIFGYWRGAERLPDELRNHILSAAFGDGWFWYIPLHDDTMSVGAVVDVRRWDTVAEADPEATYRALV